MELDHSDSLTTMDPLAEDMDSPVPYLTHRYPDRVLMVVQLQCAMYCRFCTRRREVGSRNAVTKNDWDRQIEYIASNPKVRDVIISGGDPFMLLDHQIDYILKNLRAIPHMEIIRLDSRMPVTLPHRVTENPLRNHAAVSSGLPEHAFQPFRARSRPNPPARAN